jgi:hypothetical protein
LAPQHLFGQPRSLWVVKGSAQSPLFNVLGLPVLFGNVWLFYANLWRKK